MIKRFFTFCAAALFPWLVLLLLDNPSGAVIALVMQASVIGWIPASMWAWRSMREVQKEREIEKQEAKLAKQKRKANK